MRWTLWALTALLGGTQYLWPQSVVTDSLFAPSLASVQKVNVLLPRGFDTTRTYGAMILLHGFGGDHANWTSLTRLPAYLDSLPIVILMPDGGNSWYVNSATDPSKRFEDYITNDVVRFGARRYHVDTTRLTIGGLSMGGYGALEAGLRHPERFRFIAGLSASLDVPNGIPDLERNHRESLRTSLVAAFGADSGNGWREHDVFTLIRHLNPRTAPFIYLASGIQDEFELRLPSYRAFADSLRARGLPYEYHETPGHHDWNYWDREIHAVLIRLRDFF